MLEIGPVVEIFQSSGFRTDAAVGPIEVAEPLSNAQLSRVAEELPSTLFEAIRPLLRVTGGLELSCREGSEEPYSIVSLDLRNFTPEIWRATYPVASEMGAFEELLYWDLLGDPPGRVFFVDHDGPSHTHAFDSLAELLILLTESSADRLSDRLFGLARGDAVEVPLSDFTCDSQELSDFLGRFPGHFTVHDLRKSVRGSHFYYNRTGPDGIARYGNHRLFVQRQPVDWLERMKWSWSPKKVFNLEPIETAFSSGDTSE